MAGPRRCGSQFQGMGEIQDWGLRALDHCRARKKYFACIVCRYEHRWREVTVLVRRLDQFLLRPNWRVMSAAL